MKSIKELNNYCKKKKKVIVLDGFKHKGYLTEKTDNALAKKVHKKLKKGKVF